MIDETEVRDIVEQCYKPMVKAISYTLSPEGELTLFSHAPIGLETVKALAGKFNIPYRDNSIRNLIHTIDKINTYVQKLLDEKTLAQVIESEGHSSSRIPIPLNQPLRRLIWNRALGNELITEPTGGFKVRFVYGHVGVKSVLKNGNEALPDHENLDNLFGKFLNFSKTTRNNRVQHFTRQASEITAKKLTEEKLQEISKKFYEIRFNTFLDELKLKTIQLIAKREIDPSNYAEAGSSAILLIEELEAATDFFADKKLVMENFQAFKEKCERAISDAEGEFVKHRSWHQQLNPVLRGVLGILALMPLGIPALLVSLKSHSGYYATFFGKPTTESAEKLNSFKGKLEEMCKNLDKEIQEDNEQQRTNTLDAG